MRLSKKTFLYSIILAAVMVAFITGYFVFMLPSLYVDYMMDSNLKSAADIHRGYQQSRSYDGLTVRNPSSTYSLEIPREGNELFVTGKFFRLTLTVRDEDLLKALGRIREALASLENGLDAAEASGYFRQDTLSESPAFGEGNAPERTDTPTKEDFDALLQLLKEKLKQTGFPPQDYPLGFAIEQKENRGVYREEYARTHLGSDGTVIFEAGVSDDDYSYTTYVAVGACADAFLLTVLPTMTPQMEEIRPVVSGSMPMIVAVVFLLVLLSSRYFSGKIVNPIVRLAGEAKNAGLAGTLDSQNPASGISSSGPCSLQDPGPDAPAPVAPVFDVSSGDEIGDLGRALGELYTRLHSSYLELARKNRALEEENLRREVFLRATSHQLKTPISAALLLVEGMMDEIGKYRDARAHLPEVKRQLLSMRKIVEDILYLNYHTDRMQKEPLRLEPLVRDLLGAYAVQSEDAGLKISIEGDACVQADREILKRIIDNLLSNAVSRTPPGGQIKISIESEMNSEIDGRISEKTLAIRNYGASIPKELLPHIFEPFVSGNGEKPGKGLGLYVAAYYSRLCGIRLRVKNETTESGSCVLALLTFCGEDDDARTLSTH